MSAPHSWRGALCPRAAGAGCGASGRAGSAIAWRPATAATFAALSLAWGAQLAGCNPGSPPDEAQYVDCPSDANWPLGPPLEVLEASWDDGVLTLTTRGVKAGADGGRLRVCPLGEQLLVLAPPEAASPGELATFSDRLDRRSSAALTAIGRPWLAGMFDAGVRLDLEIGRSCPVAPWDPAGS